MSTDRDVTRIVRSWLEEGATALPDRVLDGVLDRLPATPQRRAWWPARRLREMNSTIRIALAAAAVVAVVLIAVNMLPRQGGIGAAPSPTPSASPSPATAGLPIGSISPGTYFIRDRCCVGTKQLNLTVPAGWETFDPIFVYKHPDPKRGGFGLSVEAWLVGNIYTDPCHRTGSGRVPAVGPTVDDLVNALAAQNGPNASAVTDTILGGYPAKKIILTVPAGLDLDTCTDNAYAWWSHPDDPSGWGPRTFGTGRVDTVYVLDVEGTRQVINAGYVPGSSAADLAELEQIVTSISFEAPALNPSPSL